MKYFKKINPKILNLFITSFGFSALVTVGLASICDLHSVRGTLGDLVVSIIFSVGLWLSFGVGFFSILSSIFQQKRNIYFLDEKSAVCFLMSGVIFVEMLNYRDLFPDYNAYSYYLVIGGLQLGFLYLIAIISARISGVTQKFVKHFAIAIASVFGTYLLFGFMAQSWMSLQGVVQGFGIFREALILLAIPTLFLISVITKPGRLKTEGLREAFLIRFAEARAERSKTIALILLGFGGAIALIGSLIVRVALDEGAYGRVQFGNFLNLSWVGVFWLLRTDLAEFAAGQDQSMIASKLTASSVKRFVQRHLSMQPDKPVWAAVAGVKSANFVIDHDPGGHLREKFPATLWQIREEEIERCILEILGPVYLNGHNVDSYLSGTLDPEKSVRPCVDVLKLCSCLYLDVGLLIERRLTTLNDLLPILDPDLSKMVKSDAVSRLMRRNQWLFYLDFNWVDQRVIQSSRAMRYGIRIETLPPHVQRAMLKYLETNKTHGNFIWLGPNARDRLLLEAPILNTIIEPCPIYEENSRDELLTFVIKFEQLIPRLQKYFHLDKMREVLSDFGLSAEAVSIMNIVNLQLSKAASYDEVNAAIETLMGFPWKGFREKDNALQLIVKAYKRLDIQTVQSHNQKRREQKRKQLGYRLLQAVDRIGYPTQVIHGAIIDKLALRDMNMLIKSASKPWNPRFEEAWLFISTADATRYSPEERVELYSFLTRAISDSSLITNSFVQIKLLDAVACLAADITEDSLKFARGVINLFAKAIVDRRLVVDVCCRFLDIRKYLEDSHKIQLRLHGPIEMRLDEHFKSLKESPLDNTNTDWGALSSRWQLYRETMGLKESQKKAS